MFLAVALALGYAVIQLTDARRFPHTPLEAGPIGVVRQRLRALLESRSVARLAEWLKALRWRRVGLRVAAILAALALPARGPRPSRLLRPWRPARPRAAYGRHWTSAEAYLKQCEERLRAAKESWLAASEASQAGAASRARRALESATRALERAREYRDQADVAARLAGVLPAALR